MSSTVEDALHNPRYREVRKVTLIGSVVDFLLGLEWSPQTALRADSRA